MRAPRTWFAFTVPGNPPSVNHLYKDTVIRLADGSRVRSRAKNDGVEAYQTGFTRIARAARPSDFQPKGQIIVTYELVLHGRKDVDNVMKVCNDALAIALGVNDNRFLIATPSRTNDHRNQQVVVGVYDAETWQIEVNYR